MAGSSGGATRTWEAEIGVPDIDNRNRTQPTCRSRNGYLRFSLQTKNSGNLVAFGVPRPEAGPTLAHRACVVSDWIEAR